MPRRRLPRNPRRASLRCASHKGQTDKSFLVLFFKKEQALLFEKRSKNFSLFWWGAGRLRVPNAIALSRSRFHVPRAHFRPAAAAAVRAVGEMVRRADGLGQRGDRAGAAVVRLGPAAAGGGAGRGAAAEPDAAGPRGSHLCQFRRRGGRAAAPVRPAALPARRRRGGGGPAVLFPWRHRPDRHRPRRAGGPRRLAAGAGRLDHHPAGGEEPVPHQCPHAAAQGAGSADDAVAGTQLHQARNSGDLAQPRLSWLRRLGGGRGGADVFRRLRPTRDAVAGGGAGRAAARALALQSAGRSRRRRRPRPRGADGDGGGGRDQARAGAGRRGADRLPAEAVGGRVFRRLGGRAGAAAAGAGRRCGAADQPRRQAAGLRGGEAGGLAGRAGCDGRRRPGRGGGDGRADRRGARHGRRAQLPQFALQPRRAGAAPARLGVQALRLGDSAGKGPAPGRPRARRADPAGRLGAGQFRRPLPRRDHLGGRAGGTR